MTNPQPNSRSDMSVGTSALHNQCRAADMLAAHMKAKEDELVAISKVPANAGHPLHKGTPREAFIKTFLEEHLPTTVSLGTGEIFDHKSQPKEPRNQFDLVVFKQNYPKLSFGGDISGFLIESVVSTVEVKSSLTKSDLKQAMAAAQKAKNLEPKEIASFTSGYIPPKILNFVVAYDGPASMGTVLNWMPDLQNELGIVPENLPIDGAKRAQTPSNSIDGIFVMNKGFIYFDNVPMGFANDQIRQSAPDLRWVVADCLSGSLMMFFLLMQGATANMQGKWLDTAAYLQNFSLPKVEFGRV